MTTTSAASTPQGNFHWVVAYAAIFSSKIQPTDQPTNRPAHQPTNPPILPLRD